MTTTKKTQHHARHNYFSSTILQNPDRFVRVARKALKGIEFDTFVVRGMSGAIAGGILARSMKKNLFVVRKETDDSHDGTQSFGDMGTQGWVFLDDFISSGETLIKAWDGVQADCGDYQSWDWNLNSPSTTYREAPPMVGAYLYRDDQYRDLFMVNQNLACSWVDSIKDRAPLT